MDTPIRSLKVAAMLVCLCCASTSSVADGYRSFSDARFPVTPIALTLNTQSAQTVIGRAVMSSVFIIGADEKSLHWARMHRRTLIERQAIGLLIEARSQGHVEQIKAFIGIDALFVLSDDRTLASELSIAYYPVLIDSQAAGVLR